MKVRWGCQPCPHQITTLFLGYSILSMQLSKEDSVFAAFLAIIPIRTLFFCKLGSQRISSSTASLSQITAPVMERNRGTRSQLLTAAMFCWAWFSACCSAVPWDPGECDYVTAWRGPGLRSQRLVDCRPEVACGHESKWQSNRWYFTAPP